jgi:hypothetical protein
MDESAPIQSSTLAMRRRKATLKADGWKTSTIAFSPHSLEVIDGVRCKLNLTSREAAVNAVLERIGQDMFLRQEFLAVTP